MNLRQRSKNLLLLTVIHILFCFTLVAEEPVEIPLENFNQYKNTTDFLDTWTSRSDGYKNTLKENSYYYYIKEDSKNPLNKYSLCII